MKNALAAAAALMIICSSGSVFAALPPGVFASVHRLILPLPIGCMLIRLTGCTHLPETGYG